MRRRLLSHTSIDRPVLLSVALATLMSGAVACGGNENNDCGGQECTLGWVCVSEVCRHYDGGDANQDTNEDADIDSDTETYADSDPEADVTTDPQDTDDTTDTDDVVDTDNDVDSDTSDVEVDVDVTTLLALGDRCERDGECESRVCTDLHGEDFSVCASNDQVCPYYGSDGLVEVGEETVCVDGHTLASCPGGEWTSTFCEGLLVCGVAAVCQVCPADETDCVFARADGQVPNRLSVGVLDGGQDVSTAVVVIQNTGGLSSEIVARTWSLDSDEFGEAYFITNDGDADQSSTPTGWRSRISTSGTGAEAEAVVSWIYGSDAHARMLDASGAPVSTFGTFDYPEFDVGIAQQDVTLGSDGTVTSVVATELVFDPDSSERTFEVWALDITPEPVIAEAASHLQSDGEFLPYYEEIDIAPVQDVHVTAIRTSDDTLDISCTSGTTAVSTNVASDVYSELREDSVRAFGAPGHDAIIMWTNADLELQLTQVTYNADDGCVVVGTDTLGAAALNRRYQGSMWSDGSYVVTYVENANDTRTLMAARYGSDGVAMGDPVAVARPNNAPERALDVATYGQGDDQGFVVVWDTFNGVFARAM